MEWPPRRGIRVTVALVALAASAALLPASALGASSIEDEAFDVADAAQEGEDAFCGAASVATSGGVRSQASYADGVYLNTSRPGLLDDHAEERAWTVWVDNYSGGESSNDMNLRVVCDTNGVGKYEREEASVVMGDASIISIRLSCDPGEVAVGGGATSSGFYPDETYLATSAPSDGPDADDREDDAWQVLLNNDEGGEAQAQVTAYTICDTKRRSSDFSIVQREQQVPDAAQRSQTAACPSGQALVGGGVASRTQYKHGLYINSTYPKGTTFDPSKWTGTVDNYDTPDNAARKFTVTAICKR